MNKSLKYKLERFFNLIIYFSLGYLISIGFMNQTAGSAGPMSFIFSWGSLLYFLLFKIRKLVEIPVLFKSLIHFYIFIGVFMIGYLASIMIINTRWTKKHKSFPFITIIYHFLGVGTAYFLRLAGYEEAGRIYLFLFLYPVLSAMAALYIYLDWRLAKRLIYIKNESN